MDKITIRVNTPKLGSVIWVLPQDWQEKLAGMDWEALDALHRHLEGALTGLTGTVMMIASAANMAPSRWDSLNRLTDDFEKKLEALCEEMDIGPASRTWHRDPENDEPKGEDEEE